MNSLQFTIPGPPVPQGRPRFARISDGVRTYSTKEDKAYRVVVRRAAMMAILNGPPSLNQPVKLDLTFYVRRPPSRPKRCLLPDRKPDLDNLEKAVKDGMEKIIYVNDSRVTDCNKRKRYAAPGEERVEVVVEWRWTI